MGTKGKNRASLNRNSGRRKSTGELARALANLAVVRQELELLYTALDNVQSGILLLDGGLRATYSNPAMHVLFKSSSPEEIRNTRPLYSDLQREAVAAHSVEANELVAQRFACVVSGDPGPMDILMKDGTVLRCHIAVLPGGGRMLIYSDVTDIVRNAERMEQLATTDGMTGINNRRNFITLANREWVRAKSHKWPLSLMMIDIDNFKAINDRFGHEVGDLAIVHVAKLAQSHTRSCDVLARIGGEEFALLLPQIDALPAQETASRLCHDVAACPFAEGPLSLTISVGVAVIDDHMRQLSDLMRLADAALYRAKRGGRNRVACEPPFLVAPALDSSDDGDYKLISATI